MVLENPIIFEFIEWITGALTLIQIWNQIR